MSVHVLSKIQRMQGPWFQFENTTSKSKLYYIEIVKKGFVQFSHQLSFRELGECYATIQIFSFFSQPQIFKR